MKSFFAVLLLMGLAVGCSGNSNKVEATAATPATSPAEPAPSAVELAMTPELKAMSLAQHGKQWARVEKEGSSIVAFVIYPVDDDQSDPLRDRPRLGVMCDGHGVDVDFTAGALKDASLKFRFDSAPAVTQTWRRFGPQWVPASAQKGPIIKGLASAQKVILEYHPSDKGHEVVNFNLADYRDSVLTEPRCKM